MTHASPRWQRSLACLLVVVCAGLCADVSVRTAFAADEAPTTRPATQASELPIVYTYMTGGQRLTPLQTKLIMDVGIELKPKERELWFLAVHFIGPHHVQARVVYTPDAVTPRLCKGRYADVRLWKEYKEEDMGKPPTDEEYAARSDKVTKRLVQYAHVSRQGKSFGEKLEVPSFENLPFPAPEYPENLTGGSEAGRLDDASLVKLIDLARTDFRTDTRSDPICFVVGNSDGLFDVGAGVSNLGGVAIHAQMTGDRFEVVQSLVWGDGDPWPPACEKVRAARKKKRSE